MADREHIYAVARVRARETHLLDSTVINQMASAKNVESMYKILYDIGFGNMALENTPSAVLESENDKMWNFLAEVIQDLSELDTLRIEKDFHNIKAAVKLQYMKKTDDSLFEKYGTTEIETIKDAISNKSFSILPENLRKPAQNAYEIMFKTGDGQLVDISLDKDMLLEISRLAEISQNKLLIDYADMKSAIADIKIAIRGQKAGKDRKFFEMALVPCKSLNYEWLLNACVQGEQSVYSYLETTAFKDAIEAIKTDFAVFECWCDNKIMAQVKKQKYVSSTISPVVAFIIARQTEIKMVRILTVAKRNGFPQEEIKKRMRDMYV